MVLPGSCQSGWPVLPSRDIVSSGPRLLPKAMSGSVALLQPSSVLMSKASVAIEGQVTAGIWVATWGHISVQGPS